MASEGGVVWFRDSLLLNVGVMIICVASILSRVYQFWCKKLDFCFLFLKKQLSMSIIYIPSFRLFMHFASELRVFLYNPVATFIDLPMLY